MTTDRRPKTAARTVRLGGATVTLLGCTKGAGMIMPNMATTLSYVVTDAALAPGVLQTLVQRAAAGTYNAIAVDGDTSTNDMLAVLASGRTGARIPSATSKPGALLAAALTELLGDLSTQLMSDGEGVHHVVGVAVSGARTDADALTVARRIAISPLVKTAIAGGDPNWGRILCAAGNAGVALRPERLALRIAGLPVVARGTAHPSLDDHAVASAMRAPRYDIALDLGAGKGRARYLACDLSHEYVSINADYRS